MLAKFMIRTVPRAFGSQATRALSTATLTEKAKSDAGAIGLAVLAGALTAGTVAMSEAYKMPDHSTATRVNFEKTKDGASKFYSIEANNNPSVRNDLPIIPLEEIEKVGA